MTSGQGSCPARPPEPWSGAAGGGENQRRHLSWRVIGGAAPGRMPGPAAAAHAVMTSGSRPPCPPSSRCPWSVTTTIVQFSRWAGAAGPDGGHQPPDPLVGGPGGAR